jgi:hypothetical protein
MVKSEIDTVIQRTQRYWYVDGLGEIAVGLLLLFFGLSFTLFDLVQNETLSMALALAQPLLFFLLWWLGGKAVRYFKERLTYPRTGYVALPRKKKRLSRLILAALVAAVLGGLVGLLQAVSSDNQLMMPVVMALMLALSVALIARRFGLLRFYLLAGYTFLLGLLAALLPLGETRQNVFLFAMFGLGWVVSGGVTLARYLAHTQPPAMDGSL